MDPPSLPQRWAPTPPRVLDLSTTLRSGQAFRWRKDPGGCWLGPVGPLEVRIFPGADGFWWETSPDPGRWDVVTQYFALDVHLEALYASWLQHEWRMAPIADRWPGLRILRQDPVETLFAFACACCNTVLKITRSVNAVAARYGKPIPNTHGETSYEFPAAETLAGADEAYLRANLWGFRAPRLIALARAVADRGPDWLHGLRDVPYHEARRALAQLPGIGLKIADCVCLFGLGHDEACPVDTHIRQVAERWYGPRLAGGGTSLTAQQYDRIAGVVREHLSPRAGWAQQYLFMDELSRRTRGGSGGGEDGDRAVLQHAD